METKLDIAKNWLPRYTGMPLEKFGEYILVTNFKNYVEKFSERFSVEIQGDGTSNDYFPLEVPALPSFKLHKFVSDIIVEKQSDYRTGVIFTTNRRVWEHDKKFLERLKQTTSIGVDLETATIFSVGHFNEIARGALLLVSDVPLTLDGVKTEESDKAVTQQWVDLHLEIGIKAMTEIGKSGEEIKHFKY